MQKPIKQDVKAVRYLVKILPYRYTCKYIKGKLTLYEFRGGPNFGDWEFIYECE